MLRVIEVYWTDHKPIYFAFKLPNYVPQYHHIGKKYFFLKDIDKNNKTKIMMKR